MKPINPEKFSVNSLIWLRNLKWRRKEFFRGERSGHLNTIKRPAQGVRGAKAPRTVARFHFLKRLYGEQSSKQAALRQSYIRDIYILLQNYPFNRRSQEISIHSRDTFNTHLTE